MTKGNPFEVLKLDKEKTNSLGQPTGQWVNHDKIYGYIDLFAGGEQEQSYLTDSTHILMTWDVVNVETSDRILNPRTGKEYEVTFVDDPMELGSLLEIYCRAV